MTNDITYRGMQTKAVNYRGVQIIQNCLNNNWMVFFKDTGAPYAGTLKEMKKLVDYAIDDGWANNLISEDTYK